MEKKKILLVSRTIYPNNSPRSFRTTELVKEFARQGHEVTLYIVKEHPEQAELARQFGFKLKTLGPLKLKNLPSGQSNKYLALFLRATRRLLLMLFEYPNIELMFKVRKAMKKEKDHDLLISIAVPHSIHWGVAWARSKKHSFAKTWVADCGDPYMGDRLDSFRKLFYFKFFEKWFCRKADYISVPAEDHIQYYYQDFWAKIKVIPQGFKFEESKTFNGPIKNEVTSFAFAGRFLPQLRDPRPFLEYLTTLDEPFRFIVFTSSIELLAPFKKKLGDKLDIRGFIPREQLLFELSKVDFLLHIEFHSSVKSNSPSKFADYAIVKRPVIALNMESLDKSTFLAFLNKDYKQQMDLSGADKFRIENVTSQFLSLIPNA